MLQILSCKNPGKKYLNDFNNNRKNILKVKIKDVIVSLKPNIPANCFRNKAPQFLLLII